MSSRSQWRAVQPARERDVESSARVITKNETANAGTPGGLVLPDKGRQRRQSRSRHEGIARRYGTALTKSTTSSTLFSTMSKKLMQVPAVSIVLFFFTEPLRVSALILFFPLV